jgi:hypothetical protein
VWAPKLVGAEDPDSSGQRLRTAGDTNPAVTEPAQDASRIWQSRARVNKEEGDFEGRIGSDTCLDMLHAELAAYEGQLGEALTRRIASDIT